MLFTCQKETGFNLDLPLSNDGTLVFIDWLIRVRKVKSGTVKSYLAGIRQLHIIRGLPEPNLRSGQVKLVIRGQENIDATAKRNGSNKGRLPVTMALMKILKDKIRNQNWVKQKKFLIWAVATLAFHGGFRIHELLARLQSTFDPDFTLLSEDAHIKTHIEGPTKTKFVELSIKNPKENKVGTVVIVDVFETGGHTCPVKAFEKYNSTRDHTRGLPLFRDETDTPLTGGKLNKILKHLLQDVIDYRLGSICTHSFRSGLASLMAEKGLTDEEIQIMGRWSSRAYELYIKLPRTKRATTALRLGKL